MSLYIFPDTTLLTTPNTWTNAQTFNATPLVAATSTSEGGEIQLARPLAGTTNLAGNVAIDINGDSFRVFEQGGTARGFSINLTTLAASAGSTLLTTTGSGSS